MIAGDFQTQQLKLFKSSTTLMRMLLDIGYNPPEGYNLNDRYVIIGEVKAIDHFVFLNITTGRVLPGVFHLDDFDEILEEDI